MYQCYKYMCIRGTPVNSCPGPTQRDGLNAQRDGFDDLDAPIKRLSGAFTPTPYAPTLEEAVVPNVDSVLAAIRELLAE